MCVCICVLLYGFVKLTWNHSVTCVTVYPLDHQRSAHDPPWTIPNRQTDQHLMSSFFSSFNWDPLPFVICFCYLEPPFSMLLYFSLSFFRAFPTVSVNRRHRQTKLFPTKKNRHQKLLSFLFFFNFFFFFAFSYAFHFLVLFFFIYFFI